MTPDTLATPWKTDVEYAAYVAAQAEKTQRFRNHVAGHRVQKMVDRLVKTLTPRSPVGLSALAVGCRNVHELKGLDAAGFSPVTGIDLCSMSSRIVAMDMHHMTFEARSFDVVFASHSLEHSYDVDQVLREYARVTTPGGYWAIEVPVGYPPTNVDRQDVVSAKALAQRCLHILGGGTVQQAWTSPFQTGIVLDRGCYRVGPTARVAQVIIQCP